MDFSDVSSILHQPLETIFTGHYFKFVFPPPKRKTVSKMVFSLSELLQEGSSEGRCLVAIAVYPISSISPSVLSLVSSTFTATTSITPTQDTERSTNAHVFSSSLLHSPSSLCSLTTVSQNTPAVRLVAPHSGALSSGRYYSNTNVAKDGCELECFSFPESTSIPGASEQLGDISSNASKSIGLLSQPCLFSTPIPTVNSCNIEIPGSHDASFWREFYLNSQVGEESSQKRSSNDITPLETATLNTQYELWSESSQLEIISELESDWLNTQSVKQKLFSSPDLNLVYSQPANSDTNTGTESAAKLDQTIEHRFRTSDVAQLCTSSASARDSKKLSSSDFSFSSNLTPVANSSSLDLFNELTPIHCGAPDGRLAISKSQQAKESCTPEPVPCSIGQEKGVSVSPVEGRKSANHHTRGQLKGLALFGKPALLLLSQSSTPQHQTRKDDQCFTPELI